MYQKVSRIFDRLGLLGNNLVLKKSAKRHQILGRLINTSKIVPIWKTSVASSLYSHTTRKRFIQNFSHLLSGVSFDLAYFRNSKIQQLLQRLLTSPVKQFTRKAGVVDQRKEEVLSHLELLLSPTFKYSKISQSDALFDYSRAPLDSNQKEKLASLLFGLVPTKVLYPALSAQTLSEYIKRQMAASQKLKDSDFRSNLKTGVSQLAILLFKRFSTTTPIQGLRVVCSGRWSKTRSSRKQRFVYSRGSLKRLTFSALLDYGMSTVTTKFGVCSIKV